MRSISKTCSKCGQIKTIVSRRNQQSGAAYYRCRPCWAAYMHEYCKLPRYRAKKNAQCKVYYRANAASYRDAQLRKNFGITRADYNAMLTAQGGGCAICGGQQTTKGKNELSVDHCHTTGAVRGLLCNACNSTIGHAKDEPSRLRAAADYLERSRRPRLVA